jgi:hypothetical protein
MRRSISATELSKMAFCELNVTQKQIPNKSQRHKMNTGIKAHHHFEKTMQQLGNAKINLPTQNTARTKTTSQKTLTSYYKITIVLIALIVIGYFVIKTQV